MPRAHDLAHDWWTNLPQKHWSSCPLTENGFARAISNPKYPSVETTPTEALRPLGLFAEKSSHAFWPDSISLTTEPLPQMGPKQITDYYLAILTKGKLATLDKRLVTAWKNSRLSGSIELIASIALCETVWVLSFSYKLEKRSIATVLKHLLDNSNFHFEDSALFQKALELYSSNNGDFSDYLIGLTAKETVQAQATHTFDKALKSCPLFEVHR